MIRNSFLGFCCKRTCLSIKKESLEITNTVPLKNEITSSSLICELFDFLARYFVNILFMGVPGLSFLHSNIFKKRERDGGEKEEGRERGGRKREGERERGEGEREAMSKYKISILLYHEPNYYTKDINLEE